MHYFCDAGFDAFTVEIDVDNISMCWGRSIVHLKVCPNSTPAFSRQRDLIRHRSTPLVFLGLAGNPMAVAVSCLLPSLLSTQCRGNARVNGSIFRKAHYGHWFLIAIRLVALGEVSGAMWHPLMVAIPRKHQTSCDKVVMMMAWCLPHSGTA
jgi:hypothetical protein